MKFRAFIAEEGMCHSDPKEDDLINKGDIIFTLDHRGIVIMTFDLIDRLVNGEHDQDTMWVNHPEYPVMQFTGLHDKNGVEIYEGDIVKVPDDYDLYGFMAGETREIYFNDGGFRFKPSDEDHGRGHYLEDCYELEVIGNIHETPELLS